MKKTALLFLASIFLIPAFAQKTKQPARNTKANKVLAARPPKQILPGAYQTKEYLPLLKEKRVAIFANNTATIGPSHLVDTLKKLGVNIVKIFGPEHGFRGTANAGEKVDNYVDEKTGIPVISLYGKKRKATGEDVADVDIMLFDIQDVGARFYTYISSLQEFMESAMEFNKPLIILDRPNPNGFYVDGPVLDTNFKSFIGMQAIPIVHGMTMGEYANFLIGQGLLDKNIMTSWMMRMAKHQLDATEPTGNGLNITVIKCRNYTHKSKYILPDKPSPNIPDMSAVYWYPSTCLFEGTVLSEGRGTEKPFQVFGHPSLPKTLYAFTPLANAGSSSPKLKDQQCFGWNLSGSNEQVLEQVGNKVQLKYLLEAYRLFPDKENFFIKAKNSQGTPGNYFFNRLAGNSKLMQQIIEGKTEKEIRESWEPRLSFFKKIRKKYLMYPDFDVPTP